MTLLVGAILGGALWAEPAAAKLRYVPMPVQLAMAKAVALVEVARSEEFGPEGALGELDVIEVLSGDLEPGRLQVPDPQNMDCFGSDVLSIGERHVAVLQFVNGTWRVSWLFPPEQLDEVRDTLEQLPTWSAEVGGLRVRIVPGSYDLTLPAAGLHGLYLVVENTSRDPAQLDIATFPAEHALWLDLRGLAPDGRQFEMESIPTLSEEDIEQFAANQTRSWTREVHSGGYADIYLGSFDTDRQGMGYREFFLFRSLPIGRPGRYRISATVHGLVPGEVIEAEPLWLAYGAVDETAAEG